MGKKLLIMIVGLLFIIFGSGCQDKGTAKSGNSVDIINPQSPKVIKNTGANEIGSKTNDASITKADSVSKDVNEIGSKANNAAIAKAHQALGQDNSQERITYLETVTAQEYDYRSYKELTRGRSGEPYDGKRSYRSDTSNLYALLNWEETKLSHITVVWGNLTKDLLIKGQVVFIRWRPNHTGFVYQLFHVGSPGDFGTCEIHYVKVVKLGGEIMLEDIVINPNQLNTDLEWSRDGKFYVYAEASSLRIRNFETGIIWATKEIILHSSNGDVRIKKGRPHELTGFTWTEGDRTIVLAWKQYVMDDAPSGAMSISTDQLGLK